MTIRHMQQELTQWGAWARGTERTGGVKQYESPAYTWLKQNVGESSSRVPIVLDDDALMAVDSLIGHLKRSRFDLYTWIRSYYLDGYSLRALEKMTKVSRTKIEQYLLLGETWLDARLDTLCEMAVNAVTC